jgi:hypothetical protein
LALTYTKLVVPNAHRNVHGWLAAQKWLENGLLIGQSKQMATAEAPANTNTDAPPAASAEEMRQGWPELVLKVQQLEADASALAHENKALRFLIEKVITNRQQSHSELVVLLTTLVSKLPLNDIGVIVSRLVEHNNNLSQFLGALAKGGGDTTIAQPTVLKTLEHTKRDLRAAIQPLVEELSRLEAPFESKMLEGLVADPELFFSPPFVRANRCFVKGQVPRERIVREFGDTALIFFTDLTTDPKLNPRPKPEAIVLGFRNDFETLFQQTPAVLPDKRQELMSLYQKVQRSKANTEQARGQKNAFYKLSFVLELLHYYENQSTEAPDVIFAQRLPVLVEQLVVPGPDDTLDEKLIVQVEHLMASIISPDHRNIVINNIGKGSNAGKTLKHILRLRAENVLDLDPAVAEFVKHLIPASPQKPPPPAALAAILRLLTPERQRTVVKAIMVSDRLAKDAAEALGKAVGSELGIAGLDEELKAQAAISPEVERQMTWAKIQAQIANRNDPVAIATTIRERLHANYDTEEIKQSWVVLTEAEPMSFIKIFCAMPYRSDGRTDPIAQTILESYVTRLVHEKYLSTYNKVVNSLRNMFHAKPDSPTLLNFMALSKWSSPEAAAKIHADVGMPMHP